MAALRQPALKGWQLKYWAYLTGLPTTGTKTELQAILMPTVAQQRHETPRKLLSLDMGIRNLAYCVVEPQISEAKSEKIALKVCAWRRMDLLESTTAKKAEDVTLERTTDIARPTKRGSAKTATLVPKDSFTPAALSKTAYRVTRDLLSHDPDTILIERQRFRSGGAAAIQEWTVRVNMLESMLWASLQTMRQESNIDTFPAVEAISPARVAQFWSSAASQSLKPPTLFGEDDSHIRSMITHAMSDRRKIEKKDKVDIVRSWVAGTLDLNLQFEGDTAEIAEAFRMSSRQSKDAMKLAGGKLDDLADCLLQAVTWVKWQENRTVLNQLWQKAVDDINCNNVAANESSCRVHPFGSE